MHAAGDVQIVQTPFERLCSPVCHVMEFKPAETAQDSQLKAWAALHRIVMQYACGTKEEAAHPGQMYGNTQE